MNQILIKKTKEETKQRFRSLIQQVQIFKVPTILAGMGNFEICIEPKDMFHKFVIDPNALVWINGHLTEYAEKMHLRNDNVDLMKLRQYAIELFEDLYHRGLCDFEDIRMKILEEE